MYILFKKNDSLKNSPLNEFEKLYTFRNIIDVSPHFLSYDYEGMHFMKTEGKHLPSYFISNLTLLW